MTTRLPTALRRRLRRVRGNTEQRDAGFSLLEVMTAFTVFTLLCASATVAIVNALRASHGTQQRIDAANAAQSIIASTQGDPNVKNGTTTFPASVRQGEDFVVKRTITFANGGTQCTPGGSFTVNVLVYQKQTNHFLARSDSVVTC